MFEEIRETARKIKSLEIQGATSVAIRGVRAIRKELEKDLSLLDREEFYKEIENLKRARPTEPMLRNSIDIAIDIIRNSGRKEVIERLYELEKILINSSEEISEIAKNFIENGFKIYTHCHSSTVAKTLIKAKKEGKDFIVYNTETRPKYQGRKTAKELVENGIKVIHFVDFALNHYIREVDVIFLGADSILSNGSFINKVGSSIIAILAEKYDIPLYSLASLLKVNFSSISGVREKIEERDFREVWDFSNKYLTIKNPAFDLVYYKYVNGFFTERGLINPANIYKEGKKYLEEIKKMLLK